MQEHRTLGLFALIYLASLYHYQTAQTASPDITHITINTWPWSMDVSFFSSYQTAAIRTIINRLPSSHIICEIQTNAPSGTMLAAMHLTLNHHMLDYVNEDYMSSFSV